MSWAREIRDTLDMLSMITDPRWQAEYRDQVALIREVIADIVHDHKVAERRDACPPPPPPAAPKPKPLVSKNKRPRSPDADTVGTVKNQPQRRPFVHSVPGKSLPRGHG